MSLSERIPGEEDTIDRNKATTLFWLACLAFATIVGAFLLLQRLGLPVYVMVGLIAVMSISLVAGLSWISRTMTNIWYFYADRTLGPFVSGLGGTTDLLSGAFLALFLTATLAGRMTLAIALVLGIVFQAVLFAKSFQRSGASNLVGFFSWRIQSKATSYVMLACVVPLLVFLSIAEFDIARTVAIALTGMNSNHAGWAILGLAVLPGLFGGWLGLLIINSVLVLWMLVAVLTPATAMGFFQPILEQALELDFLGKPLDQLTLIADPTFALGLADSSATWLVLSLLALSAGFSVLPHALSRISTVSRRVDSIESVGWMAMMVFLLLSAIPLSIGLIVVSPGSAKLAVILKTQPALQVLPHFAVLFAAFNGLSATLFALACCLTRPTMRLRDRQQSERSLFPTRVVMIVLAGLLVAIQNATLASPDQLLLFALMTGAGSLFVPLVASIWAVEFSPRSFQLSAGLGLVITGGLLFLNWLGIVQSPITAGLCGLLTCSMLLVGSWWRSRHLDQPVTPSPTAQFLHLP